MKLSRLSLPALLILASAASLLAVSPQAATPLKPAFTSARFEQRITVRTGKQDKLQFLTVFIKGKKVRLESASTILISDGKQAYAYSPETKQATVIPPAAITVADGTRQFLDRALKGTRKVGREKAGGYLCDVYAGSLRNAKGTAVKIKIWVHPQWNLPMRSETLTPGAPGMVAETLNVKLNIPLADSLFALPKGARIVRQSQGSPFPGR